MPTVGALTCISTPSRGFLMPTSQGHFGEKKGSTCGCPGINWGSLLHKVGVITLHSITTGSSEHEENRAQEVLQSRRRPS